MNKFKVNVKIVGATEPSVDYIPDSESIISYAARVSNPQNQENFDTSEKLLKYCAAHKHWSVFETVNVLMEIKAPRDISRQVLRHASAKFQEFSQRYAEVTDDMFVLREARMQDLKNRQASIDIDDNSIQEEWDRYQTKVLDSVKEAYNWAISKGIAKECARVVLPEGNTMSSMYMNANLRTWIHYCQVRKDISTQKEHRMVAEEVWNILKQKYSFLETI